MQMDGTWEYWQGEAFQYLRSSSFAYSASLPNPVLEGNACMTFYTKASQSYSTCYANVANIHSLQWKTVESFIIWR